MLSAVPSGKVWLGEYFCLKNAVKTLELRRLACLALQSVALAVSYMSAKQSVADSQWDHPDRISNGSAIGPTARGFGRQLATTCK